MERKAINRADAVAAAFLFLLLFAVYAATCVPTILFEDTGEFAVGSIVLGVSHPPGYPLYVIIGKLFSLIPADERAFGVVLASSWAGAVGCCLVFAASRLMGFSTLSSFLAGAALGLSRTFWSQCAIPEVYAGQVLTSAAALCIIIAILRNAAGSARRLLALALILSLILLTHYIAFAAFFPLALLCWFLVWRATGKGVHLFSFSVFIFVCVASLNIYLPLRAVAEPAINWGGDAWNAAGLFDHLRRSKFVFWENQLAFNLPTKLHFLSQFIKGLTVEFNPLLIFVSMMGLFLALMDRWRHFLLLIFLLAVQSIGVILFINFHFSPDLISVFRVFYFGAYMSLAIFMAAGLDGISARARESMGGKAGATVVAVAGAAALVWLFAANLPFNTWMKDTRATKFGGYVFKAMRRDPLYFVQGALHMPPVSYMHIADNIRADVTVIDGHGTMLLDNVRKFGHEYVFMDMPAIEDIVAAQEIGAMPVYFSYERPLQKSRLGLVNLGPVFRLTEGAPYCDFSAWPDPEKVFNADAPAQNYETNMLLALVMSRKAQCYFTKKENLDALAILKKIGDRFPGSPFVDVSIAGMFFANGYVSRAEEWYGRAITDCPTYTEAYTKLGDIALQRGQVADARDMYNKALKLTPNLFTTMMNLANLHQSRGEFAEAEKLYKKVIKIRPDAAMAYNNLGNTYSNMRRWNDAERCYRKAIALSPYNGMAYNDLGAFYIARGNIPEAKKMLRRFLKVQPDSAIGYFNLAFAYERTGDYNTALAKYVRAAELEPEFGSAWQKIVAIQLELARDDDAKDTLTRMELISPKLKPLADKIRRDMNMTEAPMQ